MVLHVFHVRTYMYIHVSYLREIPEPPINLYLWLNNGVNYIKYILNSPTKDKPAAGAQRLPVSPIYKHLGIWCLGSEDYITGIYGMLDRGLTK